MRSGEGLTSLYDSSGQKKYNEDLVKSIGTRTQDKCENKTDV